MSRLIESIKLLDGRFLNLFYHEQRMMHSLRALYGIDRPAEVEKYLYGTQYPQKGLYKCRVIYDDHSRQVSFHPYERKKIRRLKIVEDDGISYDFKFLDRQRIDRLFSLRGGCDDVLIVKLGKVTDCSFSNIVFRKSGTWFTPATALLKGTMRQKLMDENKIECCEIDKERVRSFDAFKIINAMLEFDSPEIEVSDIVF